MDFKNSGFMYLLGVLVGLFVIAQSVYFLVKAVRRSRELGIAGNVVKRTIASSAVFAILPSVSILLGLITLANTLGLPLPWIRLSVLGAVTYELPAATVALNALGESISAPVSGPLAFNTVAWVMTLGIIPGPVLVPTIGKKIENGVMRIRQKDEKWGSLFMTALFLGMISAFLGMIFATVSEGLRGWIPCFVMIASALIMCICAVFVKILRWKWMEDYALPISMLGGMALSIPITNLVNMIAG